MKGEPLLLYVSDRDSATYALITDANPTVKRITAAGEAVFATSKHRL